MAEVKVKKCQVKKAARKAKKIEVPSLVEQAFEVGTVCMLHRVQNERGTGPYGMDSNMDLMWRHCDDTRHPPPQRDQGIDRRINTDEFCGFRSEAQLKEWFTDQEISMMVANGFRIVQVKGLITAVGKKQLLFKKVKVKEEAA